MLNQVITKFICPKTPLFQDEVAGSQRAGVNHIFMTACISRLSETRDNINVLEVGSWVGSSALTWAEAIATFSNASGLVFCVDLWEPYFSRSDIQNGASVYPTMDEISKSGISYELFQHNIKFSKTPILHAKGQSSQILPLLAKEAFDLAYIDASHYYEDVKRDIEHADSLLKIGRIICGDDLDVQAANCDMKFAAANLDRDYITDEKLNISFHPGVTMAVSEFFGNVSQYGYFWAMQKTERGYSPMDLNGSKTFLPSHFNRSAKSDLYKEAERILRTVSG